MATWSALPPEEGAMCGSQRALVLGSPPRTSECLCLEMHHMSPQRLRRAPRAPPSPLHHTTLHPPTTTTRGPRWLAASQRGEENARHRSCRRGRGTSRDTSGSWSWWRRWCGTAVGQDGPPPILPYNPGNIWRELGVARMTINAPTIQRKPGGVGQHPGSSACKTRLKPRLSGPRWAHVHFGHLPVTPVAVQET